MDRYYKIVLLIIVSLNASCQMKNKYKYEWNTYTCQPSVEKINGNENIYRVEFVRGDIITPLPHESLRVVRD